MITTHYLTHSKAIFEKWMGISPERHHHLIYQEGLKRINQQAVPGSAYHAKLERSAQWWQWWQRDWNTKNLIAMYQVGIDPLTYPAVAEVLEATTIEALREAVREAHNFRTYPKPIIRKIITCP